MVLSGERTSWLLVVAPALITAAAHEASFVLVRQACSAQRNVMLYVVIVVALALIAGGGAGVVSDVARRGRGMAGRGC